MFQRDIQVLYPEPLVTTDKIERGISLYLSGYDNEDKEMYEVSSECSLTLAPQFYH